jgi:hypothetical protein
MTFGRPTMLPHSHAVKPPLQIDDEYLQGSAASPNAAMPLARISFFLRSIELFDILNEILTIFYERDEVQLKGKCQRYNGEDQLQSMLKLNASLENFWEGIPSHLDPRQAPSAEVNECFKLQANVLYCRYVISYYSCSPHAEKLGFCTFECSCCAQYFSQGVIKIAIMTKAEMPLGYPRLRHTLQN